MNTKIKKLAGTAAIAVGATVALFAATGTAEAAGVVTGAYVNNGLGTTVPVSDSANPAGAIEVCTYRSHVAGHPFLLPYFTTVRLTGKAPTNLQIFGISTGTTYLVSITCPDTGSSKIFTQSF